MTCNNLHAGLWSNAGLINRQNEGHQKLYMHYIGKSQKTAGKFTKNNG